MDLKVCKLCFREECKNKLSEEEAKAWIEKRKKERLELEKGIGKVAHV